MNRVSMFILTVTVLLFVTSGSAYAQTTSFTYQGRLTDSSIPANGTYSMLFRLFAGPTGGTQLASMGFTNVSVANGVFTVPLDFGNNFDGNDRYLEITVGSTVLTPRQQIRSTPYTIRSATAGNALTLGGTAADQYVQTSDSRLSNARPPTAGSTNYIQNSQVTPGPQTASFSVSGTGRMETLIVGDGTESIPSIRLGNSATGFFNSAGSVGFISGAFTARFGPDGLIMDGPENMIFGLARTTFSFGNTLSIRSGGARVGATNAGGGILSLSAGTSTGSARSNIFFSTASPGPSGTADNPPTLKMVITGEGNVGIGTSVPARRLVVENGPGAGATEPNSNSLVVLEQDSNTYLQMFSPDADESGLLFGRASLDIKAGLIANPNDGLQFRTGGNTTRMTLDAAGNLGIGTAAPDQRLSVSGNASKSSGGTTWAVFSDERLKNIRGRFTPGLDALMQLQPIRFEYRPDNPLGLNGGSGAVGFSAQEVLKVLPEAVTRTEKGYLQLHSDPILWTMLNAVKEQQGQIEEQKERIRQQDEKIDSLLKLVCLQNSAADVCKKN